MVPLPYEAEEERAFPLRAFTLSTKVSRRQKRGKWSENRHPAIECRVPVTNDHKDRPCYGNARKRQEYSRNTPILTPFAQWDGGQMVYAIGLRGDGVPDSRVSRNSSHPRARTRETSRSLRGNCAVRRSGALDGSGWILPPAVPLGMGVGVSPQCPPSVPIFPSPQHHSYPSFSPCRSALQPPFLFPPSPPSPSSHRRWQSPNRIKTREPKSPRVTLGL